MNRLDELGLHYLAVEVQEFANDPFLSLKAAREVHPWLARTSFGFMITQYRAARELIVHKEKLRVGLTEIAEQMSARGTLWGRFIAGSIGDIPRLRESPEALGLAFGMNRSLLPRLNESVRFLDDFVRDLVARSRIARNSGDPDLLDDLLRLTGEGLMDEEKFHSLPIEFDPAPAASGASML